MASAARSAPLPESGSALVEDPRFQEILQRSRSLTQKILDSIADTHSSCIHTETLKLDSSDIGRFSTMATNIGIPPAPVLTAVSENFTLETGLRVMHDGLQLHQGLLSSIAPRLAEKDKVVALMSDVRDLKIQIAKVNLFWTSVSQLKKKTLCMTSRNHNNFLIHFTDAENEPIAHRSAPHVRLGGTAAPGGI
uniref:Uncharacterized protein n=1 Tax=Poecilia mexicana TaxID=48701 RepID=A0A3B3XLW6_9TELE